MSLIHLSVYMSPVIYLPLNICSALRGPIESLFPEIYPDKTVSVPLCLYIIRGYRLGNRIGIMGSKAFTNKAFTKKQHPAHL